MKQIPLDEIVTDAGTQTRAAINEDVVSDYAEQMHGGAAFPPVILFHDGNRYYMADGFHRALACRRLGIEDISADVRKGTRTDALWFSLGANRQNGTRLSATDKRHAILLALREWPDRSANQIAEQIGCGQQYVSRIREEVTPMRNLPDRVTGKDGKSYPATHYAPPRNDSPRNIDPPPVHVSREPIRDPLDTGVRLREPVVDASGESAVLYHLKRYWRQATKKDRKAFLEWIDEND